MPTPAASWRFVNPASAFKVNCGDLLRYFPDRPRGERFTIERTVVVHEGQVDRLLLCDALEPADGQSVGESRRVLVEAVARDAEARAR